MRTTAIIAMLFVFTSFARAEDQNLTNAKRGWEEVTEGTRQLNATVITERSPSKTDGQLLRFAMQPGHGKIEGDRKCVLQNEDGIYELSKTDEGRWQIVRAQTIGSSSTSDVLDRPGFHNCRSIFLFSGTLLEHAENSDYIFKDWSVDADGFTWCTIENVSVESMKHFDTARLKLDSKNDYRLSSVSYTQNLAGTESTGQLDYVYESNRYIPDLIRASYARGNSKKEEETRYIDINYDKLPKAEFSLSHYGLSGSNNDSRLLYVLAGILGVAAVAFAIRYLRAN